MKVIKQTYLINVPVEKVWEALTDPSIIEKWGGGPAEISDKENTRFSLWGGNIHGTNTKVVKNKELHQDWYGGKWDKPSKVIFKLIKKGSQTQLDLIHTDVPEDEVKNIDEGWKQYYLEPLKHLLENYEVII